MLPDPKNVQQVADLGKNPSPGPALSISVTQCRSEVDKPGNSKSWEAYCLIEKDIIVREFRRRQREMS
jgi:hypothetical protein